MMLSCFDLDIVEATTRQTVATWFPQIHADRFISPTGEPVNSSGALTLATLAAHLPFSSWSAKVANARFELLWIGCFNNPQVFYTGFHDQWKLRESKILDYETTRPVIWIPRKIDEQSLTVIYTDLRARKKHGERLT